MVVGYIEKFIGKNAKIKVLAFQDKNEWVKENDNIIAEFLPNGYVFEDSFTAKYPEYRETDVIYFSVIENHQSANDPTKDAFKIDKVKEKLFYQLYSTSQEIKNDQYSLNYSLIQEFYSSVLDKFFIKSKIGVYGPFKKSENRIMPNTGKTVNFYDSIDNFTVLYNNSEYVIEDPQNINYQVDFSSNDQLIVWFKNLLKLSSSFDEKSFNNFSDYIKNQVFEDDNVSKSKLNRIQKLFSKIQFTFTEIKELLILVPDLKAVIEGKISSFKNEILSDSKSEIEADLNAFRSKAVAEKASIENEIQNLKKKLNKESKSERIVKLAKDLNMGIGNIVDFLNSNGIDIENKPTSMVDVESQLLLFKEFGNSNNKKISEAKEELEKIQQQIIEVNKEHESLFDEVNHLKENREAVIKDIRLILDITSHPRKTDPLNESKSYTLDVVRSNNSDHLSEADFQHNFIQNLKRRNLFGEIRFSDIKKIISTYNCSFSSNLQLILAFIEATNNSIYTIIQVEPRWLSFKDLVDNGLSEMWHSAFEQPEILHFIIIRDVNLSSPECYANPLLDLDRYLRTKLPFIEKPWPVNLRIIGTIQPVPEIGLPIIKSTFANWGGLPLYDLKFTSESPDELKEQKLSVKLFNSWKCDKLELNYLEVYLSE